MTQSSHNLNKENSNSRERLNHFFMESIRELYCAEETVEESFQRVREKIQSPELDNILQNYYTIHLNHLERLEKIFKLHQQKPESKDCESVNALLSEGRKHLEVFSEDRFNWEIALILTAQKLAHYKIAAYSASAHLAINLNLFTEATLLAVDAQEEEEFINKYLNDLTHRHLNPHR